VEALDVHTRHHNLVDADVKSIGVRVETATDDTLGS
jgi:hypothetical protein